MCSITRRLAADRYQPLRYITLDDDTQQQCCGKRSRSDSNGRYLSYASLSLSPCSRLVTVLVMVVEVVVVVVAVEWIWVNRKAGQSTACLSLLTKSTTAAASVVVSSLISHSHPPHWGQVVCERFTARHASHIVSSSRDHRHRPHALQLLPAVYNAMSSGVLCMICTIYVYHMYVSHRRDRER